MSNKKRKKRRENGLKASLAKGMAREAIGTPQPTKVRHSRPAGRRFVPPRPEALSGITFEGRPITEPGGFIHMSEQAEAEAAGAPRLTRIEHLKARSGRSRYWLHSKDKKLSGEVIGYSPLVIDHVNFLRESHGEKAANDYLAKYRAEMSVKPKQEEEIMAGEQIRLDSLEQTLRETLEKVKYHEGKIAEHQKAASQWSAAAQSLQQAMNFATGRVIAPAVPGGNGNGESHQKVSVDRGFWPRKFSEVFADGKTRTQLEVFAGLKPLLTPEEKPRMYAALANAKKRGIVIDTGNGQLQFNSEKASQA